jgi:hypothetical protein
MLGQKFLAFRDTLDAMGSPKDFLGINSCSEHPSSCDVRKFLCTNETDRAWMLRGRSTDKSHRTPVPDQHTIT